VRGTSAQSRLVLADNAADRHTPRPLNLPHLLRARCPRSRRALVRRRRSPSPPRTMWTRRFALPLTCASQPAHPLRSRPPEDAAAGRLATRERHGAVVLLGAVEESNWSSGDAAAAADTGRWTRQECHWSWCADVCAAHTRRHTRLRSRFHAAERVACRLCSPSTQFRGVYTCQAIPMHALVTPQRLRRLFSPHRFPAWRAAVSPPHRPREDGLAHPAHTSISNLAAALGLPPRWRLSKPYSVPLTASFVVRRRWS
jgi:hypothetical protein